MKNIKEQADKLLEDSKKLKPQLPKTRFNGMVDCGDCKYFVDSIKSEYRFPYCKAYIIHVFRFRSASFCYMFKKDRNI